MEEDPKKWQIPAFGSWDCGDDLPFTQYFESAWQANLIRGHFWEEDADLFKVPLPAKPAYNHHHHHHEKVTKGGVVVGKKQQRKEQQRRHGRVIDLTAQTARRPTATKPVDEDLYKIPPELLCQKPKKKRLLRNLVSGCLGLSCIP